MIIICVAVRLKSERCPKKALADLAGQPLILRLTDRVSKSGYRVVWCTSTDRTDNPLSQLAKWHKIPCFRGDPDDVMSRFIEVADHYSAGHVVRVTGDNPLTDPGLIRKMIKEHLSAEANYTKVIGPPRGTKPEIIDVQALKELHKAIPNPHSSEYMTPMLESLHSICALSLKGEGCDPNMRLTVDYPKDLKRVRQIYEHFNGDPPCLPELTQWVKENLTDYYSTGQTPSSMR